MRFKPAAAFFLEGVPEPKGSTRSFRHNKTGRIVTWAANRERLRPWEQAIRLAAKASGLRPHSGPVMLDLHFYLPRPKRHFGARGVRPSAPEEHTVKPDLDKLSRAVLDALAGVAYVDDAQVTDFEAVKRWAGERGPGVEIRVWQDCPDQDRKEPGDGLGE